MLTAENKFYSGNSRIFFVRNCFKKLFILSREILYIILPFTCLRSESFSFTKAGTLKKLIRNSGYSKSDNFKRLSVPAKILSFLSTKRVLSVFHADRKQDPTY